MYTRCLRFHVIFLCVILYRLPNVHNRFIHRAFPSLLIQINFIQKSPKYIQNIATQLHIKSSTNANGYFLSAEHVHVVHMPQISIKY